MSNVFNFIDNEEPLKVLENKVLVILENFREDIEDKKNIEQVRKIRVVFIKVLVFLISGDKGFIVKDLQNPVYKRKDCRHLVVSKVIIKMEKEN